MTPSSQIGIVTGIAAEARLLRRSTHAVLCSGGRPEIAAIQARDLIAQGATLLVSFGIAGGLAHDLHPGTLVIADAIVTDHARYPADPSWAAGLGARTGAIYGGGAIVFDIAEKQRLATRTGAVAVDLESGPVAQVASAAGIPFVALRAIADPAWRSLPPAALLPLTEQGQPRIGAVFGSLMKKPGQIPGLIHTAFDTRAALRALLRAGGVFDL